MNVIPSFCSPPVRILEANRCHAPSSFEKRMLPPHDAAPRCVTPSTGAMRSLLHDTPIHDL